MEIIGNTILIYYLKNLLNVHSCLNAFEAQIWLSHGLLQFDQYKDG